MEVPLVCIVIANYNRSNDLREALLSIRKQDYPRLEILVVDNASQDESRAMLTRDFPEVCCIYLKDNVGMDGYSIGFQEARGEFIFQMDNDSVLPDRNVISEVIRRFRDGPSHLAAVATRVEEYRKDKTSVEELRNRDKRHGPLNTGGFHAGGVGFRKSLIDQSGYYDRAVFLYGSETFLTMRLLSRGYKIFFYPEILVLHKSSTTARNSQSLYYEIRNHYWMARHLFKGLLRWSLIIQMMVYDVGLSLHKRSFGSLVRAWIDGLGPLPSSLSHRLFSKQPDFEAKLREIYETYCLLATLKRAYRVTRGG
jgi:GT2 family glycosyltransferase